jgi:hypothetical protein
MIEMQYLGEDIGSGAQAIEPMQLSAFIGMPHDNHLNDDHNDCIYYDHNL